ADHLERGQTSNRYEVGWQEGEILITEHHLGTGLRGVRTADHDHAARREDTTQRRQEFAGRLRVLQYVGGIHEIVDAPAEILPSDPARSDVKPPLATVLIFGRRRLYADEFGMRTEALHGFDHPSATATRVEDRARHTREGLHNPFRHRGIPLSVESFGLRS